MLYRMYMVADEKSLQISLLECCSVRYFSTLNLKEVFENANSEGRDVDWENICAKG